jgi:WD40 repeat protein
MQSRAAGVGFNDGPTQRLVLAAGGAAASYMAATCGADGTVRILDSRGGVGELASIELTSFPYSFSAAGGLLLAGCGDGSLHVIDMATLQIQYALGANQHAVRTIDAASGKLVCSGDDGNVLVYDFL